MQQADDRHDECKGAEADTQWRGRSELGELELLVVLGIGGEAVVTRSPEEEDGRARARHGDEDPPLPQQGAGGGSERPANRAGQVGRQAENGQRAQDEQNDREGVGAVTTELAAGRLLAAGPGARAGGGARARRRP